MSQLRKALIRLAYEQPKLRPHLLPLLRTGSLPPRNPLTPGRRGVPVKVLQPFEAYPLGHYQPWPLRKGAVGVVRYVGYRRGGVDLSLLDQLGPGYNPATMNRTGGYFFEVDFPIEAAESVPGIYHSDSFSVKLTEWHFVKGLVKKGR